MPGDDIAIVPADEVPWDDLRLIFGTRGEPARCQCQYFKQTAAQWKTTTPAERAEALRLHPSGLVAYLGGAPAGWCAVEPRTAYVRLLTSRIPWASRDEDRTDPDVWSVTCFVTRPGFRRRGISRALAAAAVPFARRHGARALEGYPLAATPGADMPWSAELYVGTVSVFAAAGFTEVTHPTPRRTVMRVTL